MMLSKEQAVLATALGVCCFVGAIYLLFVFPYLFGKYLFVGRIEQTTGDFKILATESFLTQWSCQRWGEKTIDSFQSVQG